jgi:hypothetical protein
MSAFPGWRKYVIKQKRPTSGCVSWGYEIILHAADVKCVDFQTFQDDFDFDKDRRPGQEPVNNFRSVGEAIKKKYPQVIFKIMEFSQGKGNDKLKIVEQQIERQHPILISLALEAFGQKGYHIMPVVDATDDSLVLLHSLDKKNEPVTCEIPKSEFVRIHDKYSGGNDVAFLDM